VHRLWQGLTSLRLTLVLLLLLAGAAIIGTLITQGEGYAFYQQRLGPRWAGLVLGLGLNEIYRSSWFLALMGMLLVNLVACSIRRLPDAIRLITRPLAVAKYQTLPRRGKIIWPAGKADAPARLEACLQQVWGRSQVHNLDQTVWFLRFCGRLGHLGPYLIHLSIVLILVGGLVGMTWGLKGHLNIAEGETLDSFELPDQDKKIPLNFAVRLDRFQVQYYADGTPQEYRSDLSFFLNGKEVLQRACRVNDPISFQGFTFYQSTYQAKPEGLIRLKVTYNNQTTPLEVPLRTKVTLPGGEALIIATRLEGNLEGYGPALQLAYKSGPGHPHIFWVLKKDPQGIAKQPGPHHFTIEEMQLRYASGLLVKRDPGVWWVYLGFILLLPGFWLAFFTPRQRWAVSLRPQAGKGWLIEVYGASDRHREAFQRRLDRLLARLQEGAN
jgi:cytochrome c biogenesis protein